jgi:hypothetical protein
MGFGWGGIGISEESRMRRTVVLSGILAAAAVWAMAPEAFAQKKVFGLVTLREPVAITVGQLGKPVATKKVTPNTLQYAWVDEGPGKYLFAYATRGRVSAVWADYEPRTWLTLREIYAVLQRRYGEPKNSDYFPEEAKSDSAKSKAIASGEGRFPAPGIRANGGSNCCGKRTA